eukprot:scaffold146_cov171-Ochromonas_danica.AAC.14
MGMVTCRLQPLPHTHSPQLYLSHVKFTLHLLPADTARQHQFDPTDLFATTEEVNLHLPMQQEWKERED